MEQDNRIHLLLVEDSLNDAEVIMSHLRSAGFAPRIEFASEVDEIREALEQHNLDLGILSGDLEEPSYKEVIDLIEESGKYLPCIVIRSQANPDDRVAATRAGARDLINRETVPLLGLIVSRELANLRNWRALSRSRQSLKECQKRTRSLMDSSRDAISYVHEGMHIYANPIYLELFGFNDFDEIEGIPLMDLITRDRQKEFKELLKTLAKDPSAQGELETQLRQANGVEMSARMVFSPAVMDGEPCTQIVIRDEADTKELEAKLNYLKQRDLLTGLFNRQYFLDRLEDAVASAAADNQRGALLVIEFDKFDEIKESVGVGGIDLLISDIAKLLDHAQGGAAIIARLDDERFGVLQMDCDAAVAEEQASSWLREIAEHICDVGGSSINVTSHIGITLVDANTPSASEALIRAERASKEAEEAGGNNVVIFKPKAGEVSQQEVDVEWAERIKVALRQNRFQLLFQPVVSVHSLPGERYEALLRMRSDEDEIIMPDAFLPAAERTGTFRLIDRWVVENGLRTLARERGEGRDLILFLKLSTSSLTDVELLPWLNERLKAHRLSGSSLVFEVKENAIAAHLNDAKTFNRGIKQLNSSFLIDGFGTGVNPFLLLKHLQVDLLKLDCTFISGLAANEGNRDAVKSIIDTAHGQAKEVIAPCVEDAQSLYELWGMGINYIEGNFLQPPDERLDYDFSSMGL